MVSFCALMRAGVAPPFFAGVVVVVEKDEGEMWTDETKTFKSSFFLFSSAATGGWRWCDSDVVCTTCQSSRLKRIALSEEDEMVRDSDNRKSNGLSPQGFKMEQKYSSDSLAFSPQGIS